MAVALACAVGFGTASAGAAAADASGPLGPLPLSVALAKDELPAVGTWSDPIVKPKRLAGPYLHPACWASWLPILPLNETDGVAEYADVKRPGYNCADYSVSSIVLRYANKAAADAVANEYRSRVATRCEIPYPDIVNGQYFITKPQIVATVSGVDVWAYNDGAAGYTDSPRTSYSQFFMVQRENVLYFVQVSDSKTIEPHPVIPFDLTIAAVNRHLAALS